MVGKKLEEDDDDPSSNQYLGCASNKILLGVQSLNTKKQNQRTGDPFFVSNKNRTFEPIPALQSLYHIAY